MRKVYLSLDLLYFSEKIELSCSSFCSWYSSLTVDGPLNQEPCRALCLQIEMHTPTPSYGSRQCNDLI